MSWQLINWMMVMVSLSFVGWVLIEPKLRKWIHTGFRCRVVGSILSSLSLCIMAWLVIALIYGWTVGPNETGYYLGMRFVP